MAEGLFLYVELLVDQMLVLITFPKVSAQFKCYDMALVHLPIVVRPKHSEFNY
jgi:hypothetical protein